MNLMITLGNQLFDSELVRKHFSDESKTVFFMREDRELCTYYKFHKHKLIFFLAAMRSYADELRSCGFDVDYQSMNDDEDSYEAALESKICQLRPSKIFLYEIEDKFFESRILALIEKTKIDFEVLRSPMFLTSRENFKVYLGKSKKPFMKTFYEKQRTRLKVLVDEAKRPLGGRWSFDDENRLSLPAIIHPPEIVFATPSRHVTDVAKLVDQLFPTHPGESNHFWLPVDRAGAKEWLQDFLKNRLAQFGPYEDAIPQHSVFVFHSVLTPFLNTGLLTPKEIVQESLQFAARTKVPLPSLEGFIRQIIGWREFVRGIYQNYSEIQETSNFWNHHKKLSDVWYEGNSGIPPLDYALNKTIKFSYAHHIERLMVFGSLMLLLEIEPAQAHKWFMEMFIDSSDWVMGPNVYGMALFSDGGIFATKPYICGSHYYRKMGGFKQQEWCDGVDGLYWSFIEKNKEFFLKNPRLAMMARSVEKMQPEKKRKIYQAADKLREKLTQ